MHVRGSRAAVHVPPEFAQLALGLVAVADRAACVELLDGQLEFGQGTRLLAGAPECPACERARPSGLDTGADGVRRRSGGQRVASGGGCISSLERDRRRRSGSPSRWSMGGPAPRPAPSHGAPRARPRRVA